MNHPSAYPSWQPNSTSFPSPPYQDIAQLIQKLNVSEKKVDEYARLIASLFGELRLYQDIACHTCKQNIFRYSLASGTNPTGFTSQPIATSQYRDSQVQTSSSSTIYSVQAAATSSLPISTSSGGHHQSESRDRKRRRALSGHFGDNEPHTTCLDNPRIIISPLATASPPVSVHSIDANFETPLSISEAAANANPSDLPNSDIDNTGWPVEHNPETKHGFSLHLAKTFTFSCMVWCTKFSPDGTHFAVGLGNGETHIYNMMTGSKRVLMRHSATVFYTDDPGTPSEIWTARFSLDNKYIATGGSEGQINIWEIGRKRLRASFEPGAAVDAIDFSPDCRRFLAAASYNDSVCMWRIRDGSRITLFTHEDSNFRSVGFNPDGRYVAAGNDDGLLRMWDARTYQLVAKCKVADGNLPMPLAFTPDGKGIVIGNRELQCWDFTLHREFHTGRHIMKGMNKISEIKVNNNCISAVSFTFDSRWIVAGSDDQCCHDPGLTRSDPDYGQVTLTLIDQIMIGQGL